MRYSVIVEAHEMIYPKLIFVLFAVVKSAFCLNIEPNVTELIFTADTTFSLTCFDDEPITWTFPMSHEDSSQNTVTVEKKGGLYVSNLTMFNVTYLHTGYYICEKHKHKSGSPFASTYVYVSDKENLLAVAEPFTVLQVNEWGDIVIPCRPTSPDVVVHLVNSENDTELIDLPYDPKIGFTKKSPKVKDSGLMKCTASRNSTENENVDEKIFQLDIKPNDKAVKPFINASGAYHPVEGSTVVLNCSIVLKAGSTVYITWIFPDDRIKEKVIEGEQQEVVNGDLNSGLKTNYKVITVVNLTQNDSGYYTCEVEDYNLNKENSSYYLNVFDPNVTFLEIQLMAEFNNFTVKAGEASVQWILNITSHPRAVVNAEDPKGNKVSIGSTPDSKYSLSYDGRLAKFVINRVDVNDSGTYTFEAFNEHHKKQIKITLYVQDEPRIDMKNKQEFYNAGEIYEVVCSMTSYPLPRVTWYAQKCNDYPLCDGNAVEPLPVSNYSEHSLQLHILKSTLRFRATDTHVLYCSAKNELGTTNHSLPFLVTDVKEGFDASVSSSEITVDDNVTLTCGVSKYTFSNNIIWHFHPNGTKASVRVETLPGVKIVPSKTKYSHMVNVNIPRINKNYTGTYLCRADSLKNATQYQPVSIDVKDVEKPSFSQTNMNQSSLKISTGAEVKMECFVRGVPKPTVVWYKDDVPIRIRQNDSRLLLHKNNQIFIIKYAGVEDDGKYTCVAMNKGGNVSSLDTRLMLKGIHDEHDHRIYIILPAVLTISLVVSVAWLLVRMQKERKLRKKLAEDGLLNFERGAVNSLNPDLGIEDQADLLPYDSRWEFPREKLKLGKQLGSGAFGVVMKAEADGIIDADTTTTVAVKMVKRGVDPLYIRALASELKIMIHLGRHLNVVNLLGACTKNINKRELVVIVEYCKYGNLHDFLLKQRNNFINQIDENTGQLDFSITDVNNKKNRYCSGGAVINGSYTGSTNVDSVATEETLIGSDGYLINKDSEPDWRSNYRGDYRNTIVRPIKTSDLICWSFQIARGMEYLASRKVLHGDLAARNVLLADDNIVKICDFGLAKSMYASENYKRKKNELLPVRWMAVESIRDRVFSIQSDVWSFGITMWELFSLSITPYPGVEHLETLYTKLEDGYRLEKPAYAPKDVHAIMMDCWHARPTMRPTFFELNERLGELLESGLRSHYTNLNEVYLQMNANTSSGVDYLSLLNPPLYTTAEEPRYVNIPSRDSPDPEDDVELPMLHTTDNNYINAKPILFSNPNYVEFNRTKKPTYINMPK